MSTQFKFGKTLVKQYGEVGQPNPLRWEVLFQEQDGTLQPQSAKMKCRDFFNDLVGWYHNVKGCIYGFDTRAIKLNDDGVWLRLTKVKDVPQFLQNLDTLVNKPMAEDLGVIVSFWYINKDTVLIFIPRKVMESTYTVSLTTWLLRLSNYGHTFTSFEEVCQNNAATNKDNVKSPAAVKQLRFKLPEQYQLYWYYHNEQYNSVKQPDPSAYMSILHDNGIQRWSYSLGVI